MKQWLLLALACTTVAAMVAGCGGKQAPAPAAPGTPAAPPQEMDGKTLATPDQLVQVWDQLVAAPQDQINFELAHGVANDIAARGADGIVPLLKKIDVEKPTPQLVVLTLAALREQIKPEHEALLSEMTGPTKGIVTRLVSVDLLGAITSDTVSAKLAELEKDPDLMMQVAAYLAQLHKGDEAYVKRMKDYWDNPKVHDASRQEMMRRVPETEALAAMDQLCATLDHPDWPVDVRQRVVSILGTVPDKRAMAALNKAAENTPEPPLKEYAQKAAKAAEERAKVGGMMQTVEVGEDGQTKVVETVKLQSEIAMPEDLPAPPEDASPAPAQ